MEFWGTQDAYREVAERSFIPPWPVMTLTEPLPPASASQTIISPELSPGNAPKPILLSSAYCPTSAITSSISLPCLAHRGVWHRGIIWQLADQLPADVIWLL